MIKFLLRLFCWHQFVCRHEKECKICTGSEYCPFYSPVCSKCGKLGRDDNGYL